jgi:hypothetical protein
MKVQMVKIELGDGSSVIGIIPAMSREPADSEEFEVTFSGPAEISDTIPAHAVLQRIAARAALDPAA